MRRADPGVAGESSATIDAHPRRGQGVSFADAVGAWLRIALHSFGGPAGQIAVIHRVVVDEKRWVSEQTFVHALGYCMLMPGPEAQQLVTYMGWKLHGVRGGLVAGGLFIVPGFVSILLLSVLYVGAGGSGIVEAVFFGIKPAVIAIVLQAVLRMRRRTLASPLSLALAVLAFVAMYGFAVPFPLVILAAAVIGAAAMAPDAAPRPEVDVVDLKRNDAVAVARTVSIWLAVWLIPVAILVGVLGSSHVLAAEAQFFSRTAVVTFGGAYSVLSYVAQQAVEVYGWLNAQEMLDGLGMAETTPGPLIQVVQFVGFLGAYRNPGPFDPWLMGLAGSLLTTWVTFVPCFLFIFSGAPFIERIENQPRLQGALAGITAAVLGVVFNLAVWFTLHTIFAVTRTHSWAFITLELPELQSLDARAAAIGLIAGVMALRFEANMFAVLGMGALAGLLLGR